MSHDLIPPIRGRYIRFRPTAWHQHISMRVELYGYCGKLSLKWFLASLCVTNTFTLPQTGHDLCALFSNHFKFHWNTVGIVPNLSFCFCPFLFTDSLSVIVCEKKTKEIRCESMGKIRVLWANYGRLNPKTCPHRSTSNINCRASASLNNVRKVCQDKTACTLKSNSGSFGGDPCGGTYKYLLVGYKCDDWRISHTFGSL